MMLSIIAVPQSGYAAVNETVHYFTDFNGTYADLQNEGWSSRTVPTGAGGDVKTLENGDTAFVINGPTSTGSVAYRTPKVAYKGDALAKPDMVYEFRAKFNQTYYLARMQENFNETGNSGTVAIGGYATIDGKGTGLNNKVRWNINETNVIADLGDAKEWHTFTIVYSGTENTRELYVDGVNKAKYAGSSDYDNNWFKSGTFWTSHHVYGRATDILSLDYIKYYEKADSFTAVVEKSDSVDITKAIVKFSGTPLRDKISKDSFKVNGASVKAAVPFGEDGSAYEITFAEALANESTYTLSIEGVTDGFGRVINDEISFTTEKLLNYDIGVNHNAFGKVLINGEEIASGNAASYAKGTEITVTAVPDSEYEVKTLTLNGEALSPVATNVYKFILEDFSVIDVVFDAAAPQPEYVYYYTDFDKDRSMFAADGWTFYGSGDPGADYITTKTTEDGETVMSVMTHQTGSSAYTSTNISTPRAINRNAETANPRKDLVYEYRIRAVSISPYGRFEEGRNGSGTSRAVAWGGYGKQHTVSWGVSDAAIHTLDSIRNWHTIAIVYSGSKAERSVYIDGQFIAASTDKFDTGYENNWYHKDSFWNTLSMYGAEGDEFQLDYMKIYEPSTKFTAQVEKAEKTGISSVVVNFSSAPLPGSVSPACFKVNGKAVASVASAGNNGNDWLVNFADSLDAGEEYTLTVSDVKDTLGRTVEAATLNLCTKDSFRDNGAELFYGFDSEAELSALELTSTANSKEPESEYSIVDGALRINAPTNQNANNTFRLPSYKNPNATATDPRSDIKPLGVEFKFRYTDCPLILQARLFTGCSSAFSVGGYAPGNTSSRNFRATQSGVTLAKLGTTTDWHTVTILYGNENKSGDARNYGTREIWLDGVYLGETAAEDTANGWYQYGQLDLAFIVTNNTKEDQYAEVDYIRYFYPSEDFGATVAEASNVSTTGLVLDFNHTVAKMDSSMIKVNGVSPKSIELLNEKEQTYQITFGEELEYDSAYAVKINGVTDTFGNRFDDEVKFRTEKAVFYDMELECFGNGTVLINGKEIELDEGYATFEAYHNQVLTITAVPEPGYIVASATIDGDDLISTGYNVYTHKVNGSGWLEFYFEESTEEPQVVTAPKAYTGDAYTGYSFATLRNTNLSYIFKECGTVVSSTVTQPTLNAENCRVFKSLTPITASGNFGVGILDNGYSVLGSDYYMRPYAIYEKDGKDIIFYGEVNNVNFQEK